MTKSLKQIQEDLLAYILEGKKDIFASVVDTTQASAQDRLHVYRDAYYLRIIEILSHDYIVLKKMLGEEEFNKLATSYINAYPATHASIRIYGRYLSKFLSNCPNYEPVYTEMARFEWALATAFDAADACTISFDDIMQIPGEAWGYLQFVPHPAVKIETFDYNTPEIWSAINTENPEIPPITLLSTPASYIIWRKEFNFVFAALNEPQADMMQNIFAGKTFAEICESLCQWLPEEEVAQFAAGNLRNWVEEGMFTATHVFEPKAEPEDTNILLTASNQ